MIDKERLFMNDILRGEVLYDIVERAGFAALNSALLAVRRDGIGGNLKGQFIARIGDANEENRRAISVEVLIREVEIDKNGFVVTRSDGASQ